MPMAEEEPEFQQAFLKTGSDIQRIAYFGESILLPAYRGRGLGKEFFLRREAHALKLGLSMAAFCAVDRAEGDPRRPQHYRVLDGFWATQGYLRCPELRASLAWKEIGEAAESSKTLTFWTKVLRA
jgi:GNAT superfamily N-acetyltransferase